MYGASWRIAALIDQQQLHDSAESCPTPLAVGLARENGLHAGERLSS
jgi:hypothetical protein